jgi:pyruvate/2-oxoacid:ferredoxin oxidoreductase alpha subunit
VPEQAEVDAFLPRYEADWRLDPDDPHAFNMLVAPEHYMEFRLQIEQAMEATPAVVQAVDDQFAARFGRRYSLVEPYRLEDAEMVFVTAGASTGTARVVVDELRERGIPAGLLKLRLFRPFPAAEVRRLLAGVNKIAVIDRNISFGQGGIFAAELKAALYEQPRRPAVMDFIVGLGGRDITPATLHGIASYLGSHDTPPERAIWWEVRT